MRRRPGAHSSFGHQLSLTRAVLLAILLLAFALRCAGLDTQELRGDEAFGFFFSLNAPYEIVEQTLDLNEPHPVASYWVQHFWLQAAGSSEFTLRFIGVWWSVVAVALLLPLAIQVGLSPWSGKVAMLLLAISPYVIWHAQDARMYSMSLALTLASSLAAAAWWRARRPAKLWFSLAYVAVTWLALQTHYYALYIVAAQQIGVLGWAVAARAWGKLARWWLMGLALLLMWLPWLWAAREILLDYTGNGDSPGLLDALVRAHGAFGAGESVGMTGRWIAALAVLGGMGIGAWILWRAHRVDTRRALWFLGVYWLIPLAATWVSALNRPIFNERYLVAAVPPVYLLVAAAVETIQGRGTGWRCWLGPAWVAAVCVTMVFGLVWQGRDDGFSKTRGWRELAVALGELSAGVDPDQVRLGQNYPDPTLWYYYQGDVPHLVLPPSAHDQNGARAEVARMAEEGVGRVLLVEQPSPAWDHSGMARAALQTAFHYGGETLVGDWPVSIWLRPTQPLQAHRVEYEGGLRVTGVSVIPEVAPRGAMVEVHLEWDAEPGAVAAQEAVSVQLLNAAGGLVAQSDRPLAMASRTTAQAASYAILLPSDLPLGDYAVVLVVYDPSQANSPRRVTLQGDEAVNLGSVTVTDQDLTPDGERR